MSRTVVAVIVLVAVGVGVMFALGVFDGDDEPSATTGTAAASASTSAEVDPTTTAPPAPTTVGDDPLCVAHSDFVSAVDGHLPVEDAEDLQTYQTANLAFYTQAVAHVDPPAEDAFSEMRDYQQAVYDWAEANDWNPTRDLGDLAENPPPTVPADAVSVVTEVLEDRCDVVPIVE